MAVRKQRHLFQRLHPFFETARQILPLYYDFGICQSARLLGAHKTMKIQSADVLEVDFKKGEQTQEQRVAAMKADLRTVLKFPGLKDIKKVETQKYVDLVGEAASDAPYAPPSSSVIEKVKSERKEKAERRNCLLYTSDAADDS